MKTYALKIGKFLLGWPLSILALYFIWIMILPQAGHLIVNLKSLNLPLFLSGIVCFLFYYLLRSCIWQKLLAEKSHIIPYKKSLSLWAISEMKRYIPGKFWFILGRAASFSDLGVPKKVTGMLIINELQLFVIGSLIVSLLSVPFILEHFTRLEISFRFAELIAIIITTMIILIFIFNRRLIDKLPQRPVRFIRPFLPDNPPSSLLFLVFISAISLVFYGIGNYFVISAITTLDPGLILQLTGLFTLSFLLGFLSFFTPAGLGVREGVMTVGLAKLISISEAGFASIFARIMLVISELIFIALSFIWHKAKSKKVERIEEYVSRHIHELILLFLFTLYSIYFTIVSFARFDNFYTGRFDLGNMTQTVWNTSQGRIFMFTNPDNTEIISRLAFHADFILVAMAPFYYLWSSPKVLLLIQTIVIAAGAFFVYAIAKDILKNKNLALAFAFSYLIYPSLQRANIFDFHAVALGTCFLLGTFYYYYKKKYLLFVIFAILAALTKEQIWAITGLFGVFIFIAHRKRILGTSVFLISIAFFYFLIWHAIPLTRGSDHFALSYFSTFGNSPGEIVTTAVFSPGLILGIILQPDRLEYLRQLFLPVGFLPFLSPVYLIFAIPDLLINLLSSNSKLHQIYYQYTSGITPFIFITSIFGLKVLRKFLKLPLSVFILYILSSSLIGAYFFGPLPGAISPNIAMFTQPLAERDFYKKYLSEIPEHLSVSATNNIGSHIAHRERLYTVPNGLDQADMIVFLIKNSPQESEERNMIEELRRSGNYILDIDTEQFIVFKKL